MMSNGNRSRLITLLAIGHRQRKVRHRSPNRCLTRLDETGARLMKLAQAAEDEPVPEIDIPAEITQREALIAKIDTDGSGPIAEPRA
jgi:hypothetical protein